MAKRGQYIFMQYHRIDPRFDGRRMIVHQWISHIICMPLHSSLQILMNVRMIHVRMGLHAWIASICSAALVWMVTSEPHVNKVSIHILFLYWIFNHLNFVEALAMTIIQVWGCMCTSQWCTSQWCTSQCYTSQCTSQCYTSQWYTLHSRWCMSNEVVNLMGRCPHIRWSKHTS